MAVSIVVRYADPSIREQRESIAHRVVAQFGEKLPQDRLLCFLDGEDWPDLRKQTGIDNRGLYTVVDQDNRPSWWWNAPAYLVDALAPRDEVAFDSLVYVHGSTCSTPMGLTMTLAHELQHHVQRKQKPSLWAANTLVPKLPKHVVHELGLTWCDIPHELEARIISKRIAEALFGADAVRQYVEEMIRAHVTDADAADWQCISQLEAGDPFDLSDATTVFFPRLKRYRSQLLDTRRYFGDDPVFASIDLDALLDGRER